MVPCSTLLNQKPGEVHWTWSRRRTLSQSASTVASSLLLLFLLSLLGLFLTNAYQPLVHPLLTELVVPLLGLHFISDRYDLYGRSGLNDWQDWSSNLGCTRQLLGGCISSLNKQDVIVNQDTSTEIAPMADENNDTFLLTTASRFLTNTTEK